MPEEAAGVFSAVAFAVRTFEAVRAPDLVAFLEGFAVVVLAFFAGFNLTSCAIAESKLARKAKELKHTTVIMNLRVLERADVITEFFSPSNNL